MALLAFTGFSASANAVVQPDCKPHGNPFGVFGFHAFTQSHSANVVSAFTFTAVLCGSEIEAADSFEKGGSGTQFIRAKLKTAPGVVFNSTSGMDNGTFVGVAEFNLLTWYFTSQLPYWWDDVGPLELRVDNLVTNNNATNDCPDQSIACYKVGLGEDSDVYGWWWVTKNGRRYTLTMGEIYNEFTYAPAGTSKIVGFFLCAYAGSPQGVSCGSGEQRPFVVKNGDPSMPNCENGNGIFRLTATTRDGLRADPAKVCIEWEDGTLHKFG